MVGTREEWYEAMHDSRIRVLVADGNELFRLGLSCLLERETGIEVVGVASTATETLLKITQHKPDVLIIECSALDSNGLLALLRVVSRYTGSHVAVIAALNSENDLETALRLGVQGYFPKDGSLGELVEAVHSVARGEVYYSRAVYERAHDLAPAIDGLSNGHNGCHERGIYSLSERERSVLRLVAAGATNQEIGDALGIATNTVKVHLRAILDKLQVRNRQQAAAYAIQEGLVGRLFPRNDEPVPEYAGAGTHNAQSRYSSH